MDNMLKEKQQSFSQISEHNALCLALRDCDFFIGRHYTKAEIDPCIYQKNVLYSPTDASNLGKKFAEYGISSSASKNRFVKTLLSALKVEYYFFNTYTSNKANVSCNLEIERLYDNTNWLIVNCGSGISESIYKGVRNALAHGNIVEYQKYYFLYSVSSRKQNSTDNSTNEEKPISFLLKIDSLDKLAEFVNVLNSAAQSEKGQSQTNNHSIHNKEN